MSENNIYEEYYTEGGGVPMLPQTNPKKPGYTGYFSIDKNPYAANNPDICSQLAQQYGAFAWDPVLFICEPVFGKVVPIGSDEASIQEGFEIVNFNFRINGSQPPVPTPAGLPGPVNGFNQPGIGGRVLETA